LTASFHWPSSSNCDVYIFVSTLRTLSRAVLSLSEERQGGPSVGKLLADRVGVTAPRQCCCLAINRADIVQDSTGLVTFVTNTGSFDTFNLTSGSHTKFAHSTIIHAGYVTPLRDGNHRFFDNEFNVAVIFCD